MSLLIDTPDLFATKQDSMLNPAGYKGLMAFHKYWGKKPIEIIDFLTSQLTLENEIVLDPFLGGALITRVASDLKRRFIGIDVNPVSIELGNLFVALPSYVDYKTELNSLEKSVRNKIDTTYLCDDSVASHYLWEGEDIQEVWFKNGKRIQAQPATPKDRIYSDDFNSYAVRNLRQLKFFHNSRINTKKDYDIRNLFTGRALHNIDLLLDEILKIQDPVLRRAFLLTLTSASGQMSKMVFAISKRGKVNGDVKTNSKTEVGSWAIGFWCPQKHFEVNVWNCFANRSRKLEKILTAQKTNSKLMVADSVSSFFERGCDIALSCQSALDEMKNIPDGSVSLIITDPPHSDRMPYLELSEFWNAILQADMPDFLREIVVSNAKGRNKSVSEYNEDMNNFLDESYRTLSDGGFLVVFFNAKDPESWVSLENAKHFNYIGCFPMNYSANSIVQDNRKGAMKSDYVLVYSKGISSKADGLKDLPSFVSYYPMKGMC